MSEVETIQKPKRVYKKRSPEGSSPAAKVVEKVVEPVVEPAQGSDFGRQPEFV